MTGVQECSYSQHYLRFYYQAKRHIMALTRDI